MNLERLPSALVLLGLCRSGDHQEDTAEGLEEAEYGIEREVDGEHAKAQQVVEQSLEGGAGAVPAFDMHCLAYL